MLMSPDSSSADPADMPTSCPSGPSMIQVPECTQSHGGPTVIKAHHIQLLDYNKKLEPAMLPTAKLHPPVYHQKPAMVPKSEEDLNLGE